LASRGWATLTERDGFIWVRDDYELITFDFVSDPSTGEFMKPLQPKNEQLQEPIDVNAAYRSFMQYTEMEAATAKTADEAAATGTTAAAATAAVAAAAG
jgi:hypothetical protein